MEIPTLKQLTQRLDRMDPQSKAQWGKMNLAQMLIHCRIAMQSGLGEFDVTDYSSPLKRWVLFPLMMRMAWPKGKAQTHPEFKVVELNMPVRGAVEEAADLKGKLQAWAGADFKTRQHAIFGKLDKVQWDALQRRHLDHHFRQFGI